MCKLIVAVTRPLSFCGVLLAIPAITLAQLPGWYSNSGAGQSIIYEDSSLRVVWGNSYIYRHPGTDNLYWYAQVEYRNIGSQPLPITCVGVADPSLAKEHIRGTEGLPPGVSGFVPADETFCSRNPNLSFLIEPGGAHYNWAIFHNVPPGGEVSLEWDYGLPYGFSPWVNPWYTAYPPTTPRPAECPPELVTLGTCQSKVPEGTAPNLIVLVHGCCTDARDVYEWNNLADTIAGEIIKRRTPWEIVVWDWSDETSDKSPAGPLIAYGSAELEAARLVGAIPNHPYEYVHFIGHSAGARLIDLAAQNLAALHNNVPSGPGRPFIHLTFLDAFTPNASDVETYGSLNNYPEHYSEHYVDRTESIRGILTNTLLPQAHNFDITGWPSDNPVWERRDDGHHWPRYWYQKSATTPGFAYGYPLSRGGGNELFNNLTTQFPAGGCIGLPNKDTISLC